MPNTNRPDTTDCDCGDLCTSCGCSECGRKTDPDTRGPLTLPSGRVVQACAECRAEEAADKLGDYCIGCVTAASGDFNVPCTCAVPVAVDEERSGAQTVRLKADPSIKETGVGWAEKLSSADRAAG